MNIKQIQANLSLKGFGNLEIDGQMGPATTAAIKNIQAATGITQDGRVGPDTLEVILAPSPILRIRAAQFLVTQDGIREVTNNAGPDVEKYLASVGLGRGYSWCMAFVYFGFKFAAEQFGPAIPVVTVPLVKTAGCMRQWNESPDSVKHTTPQPGDIGIIDLGEGAGHTFMVLSVVGDRIYTIEGNTNNNGSANGDGVYFRDRKTARIHGFLRY